MNVKLNPNLNQLINRNTADGSFSQIFDLSALNDGEDIKLHFNLENGLSFKT